MSRLDKLMQMLEADPRDAFVLYAIAQEHGSAGDAGAAIEFYDRCLTVDPDYCYAYFHKAALLHERGDAQAAAETLERGLLAAQRTADAKAEEEIAELLQEVRA